MSEHVQGAMARGAVWMVLFKFVERGLGLISTLILARLLAPGDFGLVAMAMSFVAMAELMGALGFDVALIQQRDATREHYDSAWTCNVLLGASITALMLLMAVPVATFYRQEVLTWVIVALAFGSLLTGFENIGVVAFRKELDFRREFKYQVLRKFAGFAIVVPLAFALRNHWALVVGILFSKAAGTAISYAMHPFRPRWSTAKLASLFKFSRWLLVNNGVSFFKERSTDFLLGRWGGATTLGTYNVAYELANLPTTEISAPVNRALLPGFAKMDSNEAIASAYANAVSLLVLLALPAAAAMFALAPYFVATLLGWKWLSAIPLVEILAFHGVLLLSHSSMCTVLFSRGFPARVTASNAIFALVLIALVSLMLAMRPELGLVGAGYAVLATSLLCTPMYLHQMKRCLGVSPMLFLRALRRPLVGSVVLIVAVRGLLPRFDASMGFATTATWLIVGAIVAVIAYSATVLALWSWASRPRGAESIAVDFLRGQWDKRFARA
jgi:lipopolysaccharide exporter